MTTPFKNPPVFHGGDDDLNHALAHLSWKELALGAGIVLGFTIAIFVAAVLTQ